MPERTAKLARRVAAGCGVAFGKAERRRGAHRSWSEIGWFVDQEFAPPMPFRIPNPKSRIPVSYPIAAIKQSANSEHLTSVAPSIKRAKS